MARRLSHRSTADLTFPKEFNTSTGESTTKLQYLETVKAAIDEFQSYALKRFGSVMDICVVLSINRGTIASKQDALKQIDDIVELGSAFPDLVVGVDVGGDPSKKTVLPFLLPALLDRRGAFAKLPLTFHTAELKDDDEAGAILSNISALNIRRLGHCCFLSDDDRTRVLKGGFHEDGGKVGIELCPTSNLVTRELASLDQHHFPDWWNKSDNVLLSINTDDTGLFSCDLSSEVHDLAACFGLTRESLVDIQRQAVQSSFHPNREALLRILNIRAGVRVCE